MEMTPFAPGMADLKNTTANAVHSSQLRTTTSTAISGDSMAHFYSHDDLVE